MSDQKLVLVEYDHTWSSVFEMEKRLIENTVSPMAIKSINHIGSTAIPEMFSKPIIDICIEITSYPPTEAILNSLESIGYENQGECGVDGRTWLTKGNPRKFHLHLTPVDGEVFKKQIQFRDKLRSSSELREEYKKIKSKFQNHEELDSHEYNLHKGPFVESVLLS